MSICASFVIVSCFIFLIAPLSYLCIVASFIFNCSATYNNKLRDRRPVSEHTSQKISNSLKIFYNKKRTTVYRECKLCGGKFEVPRLKNGRLSTKLYCSDACRSKNTSDNNKRLNTGGFKEGSVKNYKYGRYKGIYCDSSWELAFIIYYSDKGCKIIRNTSSREYILNGKKRRFYPDFIMDNKFYEIKGIINEESKAKSEYNKDVIFLYKNDMKPILEYVISKYGKNFTKLYDKN